MRWMAEIRVAPRPDIADPAGVAIADALHSLGYASVQQVHVGKLLRIHFSADDEASAEAEVAEMCRRLLANPVMETATWELQAAEEVGLRR